MKRTSQNSAYFKGQKVGNDLSIIGGLTFFSARKCNIKRIFQVSGQNSDIWLKEIEKRENKNQRQ